MPNPARSQTEFTDLFARILHPLRKAEIIDEVIDRFESSRTQVVETGDFNANLTDWDLSGVVVGTNTDSAGRIFVRVTGAGPYAVTLYKATGGGSGDKVAEDTSVAAGAVATFVEANSSGITGTATLASSVTADVTDNHRLRCFPGMNAMDRSVFDDTEDEDGILRELHARFNRTVVQTLKALRSRAVGLLQARDMVKYIGTVVKSGDTVALNRTTSVDDGQVSLTVTGILEDLREAMEDNTTPQSVAVSTLAAGSVTYDSGNTGSGTLAVGAIGTNLEPGLVIVKCVNETIGSEKFEVTFRPDDKFSPELKGINNLQVGKGWNDPNINVSLTLSRTYDKNGTDGTNLEVAAASGVSVTGITSSNSDDGNLYGKIVANGSNWDIEFYKASGRTDADLVAKATNIATGAVFTATQQNRSGLSIAWTAGSGPTNGNTFELDVNPWKVGPPSDVMSFAITRSAKGEIQDAWRRYTGWKLEQSGSPTVTEAEFTRGAKMTFNYE